MNERIWELAKQAYSDDMPYDSNIPAEFILRLAELIVRECAQKGFNVFDEEPDAPASDLQYYVRDGIKEHFGVEE